ncbi:hypothetical protein MLD38_007255 [Melastoma candidum]|uniref:Uncharacterized protein n=1 Tax=Melastoma candidum TaxID=119954 RepID=A0ACB9RQ68_9MYRT|nr:hypothetical protein MLD38_007255 [Melastoma candidum]
MMPNHHHISTSCSSNKARKSAIQTCIVGTGKALPKSRMDPKELSLEIALGKRFAFPLLGYKRCVYWVPPALLLKTRRNEVGRGPTYESEGKGLAWGKSHVPPLPLLQMEALISVDHPPPPLLLSQLPDQTKHLFRLNFMATATAPECHS